MISAPKDPQTLANDLPQTDHYACTEWEALTRSTVPLLIFQFDAADRLQVANRGYRRVDKAMYLAKAAGRNSSRWVT